ncbi:MAG: apolipoprotein N-acyltransferase [Candidatus Kaelpia imicola]|nr:apolipoprotein N-acyltransferase [Candidatus Kaelpia imicola]
MLLSKIWMKIFLTVLLSALLTAAGFYYSDLFLLFSLTPLIYIGISTASLKRKFLLGYFWGIITFSFLSYWVIHITFLGFLAAIFYLALYPGLFTALISRNRKLTNPFYIATLWVSLEFLRSFLFTGFPWGFLGYAFWSRLNFIQIADLFGIYGISFAVVLINTALLYSFIEKNRRYKAVNFIIILLTIVCSFCYSRHRLNSLLPEGSINNVALIQTNVDSNLKWDPELYGDNLKRIRLLGLIAKERGAELIIFPETVLPYSWNRDKRVMDDIEDIVKELNSNLILGIPYYQDDKLYNSSLLFSKNGEVKGRYFKNHLVPFGEYLPCKKILSFLTEFYPVGYYSPGVDSNLLKYQDHYFSVLICYEDIFSDITRKAALSGASFLVNQSDEGWFKNSQEIYLNNQIAVFRAIESRRSLLRSTNTGITCLIDYKGRILSQLDPFRADVLMVAVPIYRELSFYSKYGLLLLIIIVFIFVLLYSAWSNKKTF